MHYKYNTEVNRGGSGLPVPGWTKASTPTQSSSGRKGKGSSFKNRNRNAPEEIVLDLPDYTIEELCNNIFGTVKERDDKKATLMKRGKPEQKLFGYPKKYCDNETKRLAIGLKENYAQRDKFIEVCKDYERQTISALESARFKLDQIHAQKHETKKKISTIEEDLATLREREAALKGDLAECRSELRGERDQAAQLREAAKQAEWKKEQFQRNAEELEMQLAAKEKTINQLRESSHDVDEKISNLQAQLDNAEEIRQIALDAQNEDHREELERLMADMKELMQEKRDFETKAREEKEKGEEYKEELRVLRKQVREAEDKAVRLRQSTENLHAQLSSLENQSKQKDHHLDKTLETFQQNQVFSQERIAQLSEEKAKLEVRVNQLSDEASTLKVQVTKLEAELKEAQNNNETLSSELDETGYKLDVALEELDALKDNMHETNEELEKTTREAAGLTVSLKKAETELKNLKKSKAVEHEQSEHHQEKLEEQVRHLQARNDLLESEMKAMQTTYSQAGVSNDERLEKLCEVSKEAEMLRLQVNEQDKMQSELSRLKKELKEMEAKLFESDRSKRELHNLVQELKGKVRVVARIRPVLNVQEEANGESTIKRETPAHIKCGVDGNSLVLETQQLQTTGMQVKKNGFNFDRVFHPAVEQEDVFEEVSSFVQSALDGYNVCLFSYGQTGSGKTFTMTGQHDCPINRGIIPRAIDQIMTYRTELRSKGWDYTLEATYVEIYNETIKDLLVSGDSKGNPKVEIRDSKKEIVLSNVKRLPISTSEEINRVLSLAERNRSVAATDSNLHSSRSHSIFTLYIKGEQKEFDAQVKGSLSMCDLAGSERISKSGAEGDRLKEAQAINKSLSSLANVFTSINKKSSHVPYRNSKLTHMLQPCFAGQGKTMMIVNLSPEEQDKGESLCSLRFAGQVHNTELGKAKKQISSISS